MPTRFYQLESNTALTNSAGWTDSGYGIMPPDGTATARILNETGKTNLFYRIKAIVPLTP